MTSTESSADRVEASGEKRILPVAPTTAFPEGGRDGWLVVLGSFAVMFFTFGYINAFG